MVTFSNEERQGAAILGRYALSPNQRGYCGGPDEVLWARVAQGGDGVPASAVLEAAKRLSGAWAYMKVLSDLSGLSPFSPEIQRQYWLAEPLGVDNVAFGEALLAYIRPQASSYWAHLTDDLLAEARPTHFFHVLAVYPWSHLLKKALPITRPHLDEGAVITAEGAPHPMLQAPLEVLSGCAILPAQALEVSDCAVRARVSEIALGSAGLVVARREVTVDAEAYGPAFEASMPSEGAGAAAGASGDSGAPGGWTFSYHWGTAVEHLEANVASSIARAAAESLKLTNARLGF